LFVNHRALLVASGESSAAAIAVATFTTMALQALTIYYVYAIL